MGRAATSHTEDKAGLSRRSAVCIYFDATRAELSKLRSLPAIWFTLTGTLALTVLLSLLFVREAEITSDAEATADAVGVLDFGVAALGWSQIGFFLLGVIAAASEYTGGQIRTTLVAVPGRLIQRLAANTALTITVFASALLTVMISITTVLVSSGTSLGELDGGLLARIVISAAGYLTCMAILSAGLGLLIRKTIPAAAILLVYLLIISPLLPGQNWYFLPDMASYALWYATVPPGAPPAVVCWLVVITWTVATAVPSIFVFSRRDT
jgi:ABC-2 type transport system permease protein